MILTATNCFEIEQSEESDWPKASKRRGIYLFSVLTATTFLKLINLIGRKLRKGGASVSHGTLLPWFNVLVGQVRLTRAPNLNSEANEHERFNF